MKKPVIGLTIDSMEQGEYSKFPYYVTRRNYSDALKNHGAIPILFPHMPELVDSYLDMIDGLVVIGGDFDIDPKYYGEEIKSDRVFINQTRTDFEYAITESALKRDMPVLGICGGHQLINVILGGSLIQHIPDYIKSEIDHEQKIPKNLPSHDIIIEKNSLLYNILGAEKISINSTHHQAVKAVGNKLISSAKAPDGIIEAIESTQHKFCLGVEWHPEYETTEYDKKLFAYFIDQCKK